MAPPKYGEITKRIVGRFPLANASDGCARMVPEVSEDFPSDRAAEAWDEGQSASLWDPAPAPAPELTASMASGFLLDRLAENWVAGEPRRAGQSVTKAIAKFSPPRVPPDVWARIESTVRNSVETAAPASVYSAHTLLSITTQIAVWADTLGQPIDPDVLLHPEVIDRFISEGCPHLKPGTKLNYRKHLHDVGKAVLGPSVFPPRPLPLYHPDPLQPYSTPEITALLAWCRGLPTERFRDNATGVVALGLGAGLSSQEMCRLVGDDVVADTDGVVVGVIGSRARQVPVVERWADAIHARAVEVGERPFLFPERTRISRHQLPNFLERCPTGDAPQLNTLRLRNSWIVAHLSADTNVLALAEAAGVSPTQIVKYLPYAERLDRAEACRQLRRLRR